MQDYRTPLSKQQPPSSGLDFIPSKGQLTFQPRPSDRGDRMILFLFAMM